ncbi:D-alanyl-D-alanine carboxypeptidase/D-alanyl-D-alanine-endopeptidase (penicillin-binding protein 4) [Lewinella marina]|nr:D-alanyl-D-alanine carboxypeptidase [Neolewinella marina]NJB87791.1 D-alanyl-D-alanine carboxypeptidase/D-alanyl-D-alanine-endopeptidase (penicillin-binding protein 4) [Neolewinella marina]
MRLLLSLSFLAFLGFSSSAQVISHRSLGNSLDNLVRWNTVYSEGHTGFSLSDLDSGEALYGYNAERYFVPASNVKLLTFFVAQQMLGEEAPAVFYRAHGDTTDIWGTGYPLLLHPSFYAHDTLGGWLADRRGHLVYHIPAGEEVPRYGAGWSWDDYNYGYVYERSALPVYGNRLYLDFRPEAVDGEVSGLFGSPPTVAAALIQNARQPRAISRREGSNQFTVGRNFYHPGNFPLERSLSVSPEFTVEQLDAAFPDVAVSLGDAPRPPRATLQQVTTPLPDTLLRKMLQVSDNFLAEQLILLAATERYGWPDEETFFSYLTDTLFVDMQLGEIRYADGSGLSRYNLVKPRQFTQLLTALDRAVGRDRLLDLLPTGGVNGTLEKRFDNRPEPYVWAKTGSLSGVICVSGLLRSRSGRWLSFSFLHNNVMVSPSAYYHEMENTLGWVYDNL